MLEQHENGRHCIVGAALVPEKAKKHISAKLIAKAAEAGITLKVIDPERSLEEQEPFDVLLHKIRDAEWQKGLEEYRRSRPDLRVIDSYAAIRQLTDREAMLSKVGPEGIVLMAPDEGLPKRESTPKQSSAGIWDRLNSVDERLHSTVHVCVPPQVLIPEGCSPAEARETTARAGLRPPYLGKPLHADGRDGSHALRVILDDQGLEELADSQIGLPLVLQQYVDHGGCLFKVYVLGPITILVRRPSLQLPVPEGDLESQVGRIQVVGRVSAYHSETMCGAAPQGDPPHWAIQELAQELRERYQLTLFNFDLIQPNVKDPKVAARVPDGANYLLIDINFFPGFEKLPDYESLMVRFFQTLFSDAPEVQTTRFVSHSHVAQV